MNINNFNSIVGLINLIWTIVNAKKMYSFPFAQKYASKLTEKIFIPFYKNIECYLFVNITESNKKEIIKNLSALYQTLDNENLLFYISDSLLIPLEMITEKRRKNLKIREINKIYQRFSKNYYNELNRIRKTVGLKPRTPNFRIHHKLYRFKIQNYFFTHTELILFLVFLFFQFFKRVYLFLNR
ncbi:TPA: hypothetical protein ACQK1M_002321 [Enterococcus hirae]